MAIVFCDRKGVLMVESMQQGTTIMSEVYCETLKKLNRAIQNKRCGMLIYGIVLLYDNLHLHTAARTRALLEYFNCESFDHPPYSPDLALCDYHLFTYLKNWFGSQSFNNNEELMEGVKTWLSSQAAESLTQAHKNLLLNMTSASILKVTMLRSSLSMHVFFVYNKFFLSLLLLLTAHRRLLSK
jgi:histone-lysine N-methyltransferase SETMAR